MTKAFLLVAAALAAVHHPHKAKPRPASAARPSPKPAAPAALPATPEPPPAPPKPAASDNWPGPRSAKAMAEPNEVRLGQPFTVTVEIQHDKGQKWSLKSGLDFDPFKLRSQSTSTQDSGDHAVTLLRLELALFQLGSHAVPDLTLIAEGGPGAVGPHEFVLPGPTVKGIAPANTDREKRDIRGPVPFRILNLWPLAYAVGALAAAALIWLLVRALRRRAKLQAEAPPPVQPEDQVALNALAALETQGLPASGRFKEFHLELSGILRRYLGDRYGILALDMTSEELYGSLARLPSEGLNLSELQWICAQGDLAKFAKAAPTVDDCKQALHLVRQVVQRTRRRLSPAAQEVAA